MRLPDVQEGALELGQVHGKPVVENLMRRAALLARGGDAAVANDEACYHYPIRASLSLALRAGICLRRAENQAMAMIYKMRSV
mmetsp:Transcript_122998/g.192127  ORF Transcript_122998/g.192127 Transcript_122998/m.192127 type:complete len:83 (-) Transcript_122998:19-267(-)